MANQIDASRSGLDRRLKCHNRTRAPEQTTYTVAMLYSITSSARARIVAGTSKPRALAVSRLMNSTFLTTSALPAVERRSQRRSPIRGRCGLHHVNLYPEVGSRRSQGTCLASARSDCLVDLAR